MNWFKFDWFTSKERRELQALKERVPQLEGVNSILQEQIQQKQSEANRPFKNLYFAGDIITVVLKDGSMISKNGDKTLFDLVRNSSTEKEITNLLTENTLVKGEQDKGKETPQERDLVLKNIDILRYNPEFDIKGREVFLKGVNLAIPAAVVASFIEVCEKVERFDTPDTRDVYTGYNEQYQALKMFWIKLALNGLEQSREDLLRFVKENDVRITSNGNLVLYRRIVSKGNASKKLIEFISQQYYQIKKWKKSPKNYEVFSEGGEFKLVQDGQLFHKTDEHIGNLHELYVELPNMEENTYTAAHDGSMDIRIGGLYWIDESKINLNNGLCAAGGLHAASVTYPYFGFGDTPVVVLVNPSKAITVPVGESGKLRTTEMFVACVNDKPHGEHFDDGALSAFDEEYNNISIKELEDAIRDKSFKPASVEEYVSPIAFTDLEAIKDMLKGRVKKVQF